MSLVTSRRIATLLRYVEHLDCPGWCQRLVKATNHQRYPAVLPHADFGPRVHAVVRVCVLSGLDAQRRACCADYYLPGLAAACSYRLGCVVHVLMPAKVSRAILFYQFPEGIAHVRSLVEAVRFLRYLSRRKIGKCHFVAKYKEMFRASCLGVRQIRFQPLHGN